MEGKSRAEIWSGESIITMRRLCSSFKWCIVIVCADKAVAAFKVRDFQDFSIGQMKRTLYTHSKWPK